MYILYFSGKVLCPATHAHSTPLSDKLSVAFSK